MIRVHRVLRKAYAKTPFDGEGSYRFGGRWSSRGTRVAYASDYLSLAMLEYFVHLDPDDLPTDLVSVNAEIPGDLEVGRIDSETLPAGWRRTPPLAALAEIGDRFVRDGGKVALAVPSVIVPGEFNWLINPAHPKFQSIRVNAPEPLRYDLRLLR